MRKKTREDYQRAEQQQALRDARRAGTGGGRMGYNFSTAAEQEINNLKRGTPREEEEDSAFYWGKIIAVSVLLVLIAVFFFPFF